MDNTNRSRTRTLRRTTILLVVAAAGILNLRFTLTARAQETASSGGAKTVWSITAKDIGERLDILASDSLEGRRTGEPGASKAARYIASEFHRLQLSPIDSAHVFMQPFDFSEHAMDTTKHGFTHGMNIVGYIRGEDPQLADQTVIIGAHYDHLGMGGPFALDKVHAIHYGADDNASGTSGLLEIAEHLSKERYTLKRSVLFIAFSGEEEGLFGSAYFTEHPLVPLKNVQAMVNMDMIGRMNDSNTLIVQGMGTSPSWKDLITSLPESKPLHLKYFQTGTGPSDHAKFYAKDVPVLFLFTGFHDDYHKATDTRDKINVVGEAKVAQFAESVVLNLANRPDKIAFTRPAGDTEQKAASFGVYVGGVPDYGYDGDGLRIDEIRDNSPAKAAGLQKGDIVIKFDEMAIKNIYDYTNALAKHHPGDKVIMKVMRAGVAVDVPVVLGKRSSEH